MGRRVPMSPADWAVWLSVDEAQARALLRLPGVDVFNPSDADPADLAPVSRGPA